jgi:hypothetical protein
MKEIKKNTRLTLLSDIFCYKAKDFYLLTIPKIASSWAYQLFLHNKGLRDVPIEEIYKNEKNTVDINQLNFTIPQYDEELSFDVCSFTKDWNLLLENKSNIDFIFLMRDPISKFTTGVMQDVIFNNFSMSSPHIIEILEKYPNKEELNQFYQFNKSKITDENEEWWNILDLNWDIAIYNVMFFIVENIIDNWITNIENIIEYRKGHKNMNLFFYYKLLFNSNIDKTKIKILDIDKENTYDYLINKYNLTLTNLESKYKFNETASIFKKIIKKSMLKHEELMSSIFYVDLLLYCDIHNYLYLEQITPEKVWFDSLLKYRNE